MVEMLFAAVYRDVLSSQVRNSAAGHSYRRHEPAISPFLQVVPKLGLGEVQALLHTCKAARAWVTEIPADAWRSAAANCQSGVHLTAEATGESTAPRARWLLLLWFPAAQPA